jgi:PAS domain S-box-containing protein
MTYRNSAPVMTTGEGAALQPSGHHASGDDGSPEALATGRDALVFQPGVLGSITESSLTGIVVVQDDRFRYANRAFAEVLGYSPEEIVALDSVLRVVAEEDRALVAENLRRRISGEVEHLRYLFRALHRSGRTVHLEVFGTRCAVDGAPAVVSTVIDVTARVEAEVALRESERRFRGIFDEAIQFMGLLDPGGTVLEVNRSALEFAGLAHGEVVRRPIWEARPWSRSPEMQSRLKEAVGSAAAGQIVRCELGIARGDGTPGVVDFSLRPIHDNGGSVVLVIAEARDISRRRAAEEALRRSEESLRLVLRATNDLVWSWDVASGAIEWSENAPRILRCSEGEVQQTVEWWYGSIHPAERERVVSGLHGAVSGGGETWTAEYRFRRGDGSYATMLDRGHIVRDERGTATRMIGAMLDVTESRRSEETQRLLASASSLLETSLDSRETIPGVARVLIPALADYCTVDLVEGGDLRRIAAVHALPAREPLLGGGAVHPLKVHPGDPLALVVRSQKPLLIPGGDGAALKAVARSAERLGDAGTLQPCSTMVVPLTTGGRCLGVLTLASAASGRKFGPMDLLVAEDVGRRVAAALENARLYREAQEAIRARESVLAVVSHDLRNPLGTIAMTVEMIRMEGTERRSGKTEWLDLIRRSVQGMTRMVDDLLDLSSIEAGAFSLARSEHQAAELLREARAFLEPLTTARSLRLVCDEASGDVAVSVDGQQILRVISNLVGNSIKFTPEGGTIRLRAVPAEGEVRFSVADTGSGIPAEQLPRMFDRYWQAHAGDRRGAGLGLSIARGIVEAHGGRIWAESEPGAGTTVSFTVPRVAGPTPAEGG